MAVSWLCRWFLAITAILIFAQAGQAQWPQYGGPNRDFTLSGNSSEASKYSESKPSSQFAAAWSLEVGLGDSAPIFDQNRLFVSEAAFDENGQEAMQVRCLDPADGKAHWTTIVRERSYSSQDISSNFPVRPMASPLAAADRVIALSFGGCVSCLDQATGKLLRYHDLVEEYQATPLQFGWASSPWTDGQNVVVSCGGSQALLVALDLLSGSLIWKSSPGEAAYGSISEVVVSPNVKHLCYIGRDKVVGLNPKDGKELWSVTLPKQGLTNTVTPISLPDGELLLAGQGFEGSRRVRIAQIGDQYQVQTVWESRHSPFYCNWLVDRSTKQIFAYNSNVLGALDLDSGKLNWRVRGWTDANYTIYNDTIIGIRGDGFLTTALMTQETLQVQTGIRVVQDRVWTPPVIVDNQIYIRGRTTLTCIPLSSLPAIEKMPSGTDVDSMSAMYGNKHEAVAALLEKAEATPADVSYADYQAIVDDRSIRFGEADYQALLKSLIKLDKLDLPLAIARHWSQRDPDSIVAFDQWLGLLEKTDQREVASELRQARSVEVEFDIQVPDSPNDPLSVYVTGNARALGARQADGLLLKRSEDGHYRTRLQLPKGNLEFKLTQGTREKMEVRYDGRGISNRRRRIVQPLTIQAQVQAWKGAPQP